jgi:DNA-3-methyladenine glycosylase I
VTETTHRGDVLDRDGDGALRCWWGAEPPVYRDYHDTEWGRPVTDDARLFEKISLEGFQSGLSWLTILRKRDAFRSAFSDFDLEAVAGFTEGDVSRLLGDAGIVRHEGKIRSTITNARRALELADETGSLAGYFWGYEPARASRPRRVTREWLTTVASTPESTALSKDLKRRGWSFVGPTTCYAFMQAMGLVNDHQHACSVRAEVSALRSALVVPS